MLLGQAFPNVKLILLPSAQKYPMVLHCVGGGGGGGGGRS